MASDRSRAIECPDYGYIGVVAQQGRVMLDRDLNALQEYVAARTDADALDFVGPCGTPDNGFAISVPASPPAGSPPEYWSPPLSPPEAYGGSLDFLISPGTMYLGGQRVQWPATQNGAAITYSYFDQPDWYDPPAPRGHTLRELVYLLVSEQEVSAVEDPDLLEVALGGPDTTQRQKLMRRVLRMAVDASTCADAWAIALERFGRAGYSFNPVNMALEPVARLQVGFTQSASDGNPCDPIATGGYLGADNQLIRVRIAKVEGITYLLWGYDNASFEYRVKSVSSDATMVQLTADPPDSFHVPQTGQLVEILETAMVIAEEPDETDPTGTSEILRVVANDEGTLRRLAQPYGPVTPGDPTNYLVLDAALPGTVASSTTPLFVRVWQAALVISETGGTVTIADPATGISTGVTVTLTVPKGSVLADGAFWQIAVRPATPQGVYPEDLLTSPQPPDGPLLWVCPLAVINWDGPNGPKVTDCRNTFDNLVTLSRRRAGCCTVSVAPADLSSGTTLQAIIDAAAASADSVTICLAGGLYELAAPLRFDAAHAGLTIESCGGRALLRAAARADEALFTDGLVVITNAPSITLQGLALYPPLVEASADLGGALTAYADNSLAADAPAVFTLPYSSVGVRLYNSAGFTMDDCVVVFRANQRLRKTGTGTNPATGTTDSSVTAGDALAPGLANVPSTEPTYLTEDAGARTSTDLFAAALFVQGDCPGLTVTSCELGSTIVPTFTPLEVPEDAAAPDARSAYLDVRAGLTANLSDDTSSPPADDALVFNARVASAYNTVLAKRIAVDAFNRRALVVTVGILASTTITTTTQPGTPPVSPLVLAAPPAAPGNPVISTVACNIGDATISGNQFAGLTFATWILAEPTTLRVEDNQVAKGVAGIWFALPGFVEPLDVADGSGALDASVVAFEEFLVLLVLAALLPPPVDWGAANTAGAVSGIVSASGSSAVNSSAVGDSASANISAFAPGAASTDTPALAGADPAGSDLAPAALNAGSSAYLAPGSVAATGTSAYAAPQTDTHRAIFVLNNQIQTRVNPPNSAAVGLMLALCARETRRGRYPEELYFPALSVVINGNQVLGTSGRGIPAAFVTLPQTQPCAVTGNLVLNIGAKGIAGPSLIVVIERSRQGIELFSAVGNVLAGRSDLALMTRAGSGSPPAGWERYNADPS